MSKFRSTVPTVIPLFFIPIRLVTGRKLPKEETLL